MTINDYQQQALATLTNPQSDKALMIARLTLGVCGEAGEVAEKVKKILRDSDNNFSDEAVAPLKKELGDVLWYLATLSDQLGFTLEEAAQANLEKLDSRQKRDKLSGSGDDR